MKLGNINGMILFYREERHYIVPIYLKCANKGRCTILSIGLDTVDSESGFTITSNNINSG
jgi:hypothetical protein